jgi:hypothetical protein
MTGSRKLIVVGQVLSAVRQSLEARYLVDVVAVLDVKHLETQAGQCRTILENFDYDTLLVGTGLSDRHVAGLLKLARQRVPAPGMAVLSNVDFGHGVHSLPLRAGADAIAQAHYLARKGKPALLLCSLLTKGGAGKTTLAVGLAMQLAVQGKKVALVDDDPASRSGDLMMKVVNPDKNMVTLATAIQNTPGQVVTPEVVAEHLIEAHGVSCLFARPSLRTSNPLYADMAKDVLAVLGYDMGFEYVVLDSNPGAALGLSTFTKGVLEDSDMLPLPPVAVLPAVPDEAHMRSIKDTTEYLLSAGFTPDRIIQVILCKHPRHQPGELLEMLPPPPKPLRAVPIIPYDPNAHRAASSKEPLPFALMRAGRWQRLWSLATGIDTQPVAYRRLAQAVIGYHEEHIANNHR